LRDLPDLRESAAFPGWLRRIVFKYCDRHTRRAGFSSTVPLEGIQEIMADISSTALEALERTESAAVIRGAVAGLPEHQRETVTLYYIGDHYQGEIAAFLDITEGAVRKRLHDARKALKERLLDMVKETLRDDAPSKDDRFATLVLLCAASERGDTKEVGRILSEASHLARQDTASNDEHQALHSAVYGGQPEVVRLLLDAGADPLKGIYPHREATSALAMARDRGLTDIVDVIEAFLAQKRGTSDAGRDLGEAAARGDRVRVAEILDAEPGILEARDNHGRTALHRAVQGAHLGLAEMLLDRGAEVDAEDAEGRRPLQMALDHGWKVPDDQYANFTVMADLLVGRGARRDLWAAAGLGEVATVRELLAADTDPANGETDKLAPLTVAAFRGHVEVVELLLEAGADADAKFTIDVAGEEVEQSGRPMWLAANRGHLAVVRALLGGGAQAQVSIYASGSAIEQSMMHGHRDVADLLFLHGAVGAPLTYCVTNDLAALAEHLRANPDARDGLMWSAILAGNEAVVEHELAHGAPIPKDRYFNLLEQTIRGWRIGNLKIGIEGWDRRSYVRNLQRLVDAGVDVTTRNERTTRADFTILHHLAARSCNPVDYGHTVEEVVEFARILVDGGAEVDAMESQLQSTPLGWAARYGQLELCRFFLSRGADANGGSADWARPLAWARRYGHEEVATLLSEAGATA
jgi:RNA polymerase sigma factor (sigma-70 family)